MNTRILGSFELSGSVLRFARLGAAILAMWVVHTGPAVATADDEKKALKACERNLCEIILGRKTTGDTLTCDLQKTWAKSDISDGAKQKKLDWGFGDAQCKVKLDIPQMDIVGALTDPQASFAIQKHAIKCQIDNEGEQTNVSLTLAPKLEFKEGKATGASLSIDDIEAPALIKGAIWTVAGLESTFGLFESDMLKEVNKFVGQKCAKRYPDLVPQ